MASATNRVDLYDVPGGSAAVTFSPASPLRQLSRHRLNAHAKANETLMRFSSMIKTAAAKLRLPTDKLSREDGRMVLKNDTSTTAAVSNIIRSQAMTPAIPSPSKVVEDSMEDERRRKEELGRATWTLLHTYAAALSEGQNTLTRQQKKDARDLVQLLSRVYPCQECAAHWKEVLKADPPNTESGAAFQQWLCGAHNTVNRSLGKPSFNCKYVGARWRALNCDNVCVLGK